MTTLKALQSKIGINYPGIDDAATVALIDQGLNGTEEYTPDYVRQVDLACAGLIVTLITSVKSIQEGGYSVTLADREALLAIRKGILKKYGIADDFDGEPTVSSVSNLW